MVNIEFKTKYRFFYANGSVAVISCYPSELIEKAFTARVAGNRVIRMETL